MDEDDLLKGKDNSEHAGTNERVKDIDIFKQGNAERCAVALFNHFKLGDLIRYDESEVVIYRNGDDIILPHDDIECAAGKIGRNDFYIKYPKGQLIFHHLNKLGLRHAAKFKCKVELLNAKPTFTIWRSM